MMKSEAGFSTPFAMTIIFSLSLLVLSVGMMVSTTQKKVNSYKNVISARKEVDSIINSLEKDFQILKEAESDYENCPELTILLDKYNSYNLSLEDISTGINRTFMAESFLNDKAIVRYTDTAPDESFTDYGWINHKFGKSAVIDGIKNDFKTDTIFPIENDFPLLNIFYMNADFIAAVLEYCKIPESLEKTSKIQALINNSFDLEQLSRILEVSTTHKVFSLIGTKTTFWKAQFETSRCEVSCIFALIPSKEKAEGKAVSEYRLVEKEISFKRKDL